MYIAPCKYSHFCTVFFVQLIVYSCPSPEEVEDCALFKVLQQDQFVCSTFLVSRSASIPHSVAPQWSVGEAGRMVASSTHASVIWICLLLSLHLPTSASPSCCLVGPFPTPILFGPSPSSPLFGSPPFISFTSSHTQVIFTGRYLSYGTGTGYFVRCAW